MSELEVRIGNYTKAEYTVLAKHVTEDGFEYLWLTNPGTGTNLLTVTREWLESNTIPMPDFFEEKKEYKLFGETYTVWHVHEMAHEKVAVAQRFNGEAMMLGENDWKAFKSYDGFK